jgi:hypothetical protein
MKDQTQELMDINPTEPIATKPASKKSEFKSKLHHILLIVAFLLAGMVFGAAVMYFAVVLPLNQQIAGLNKNIDTINSSLSANIAASIQKGDALAACTSNIDSMQAEMDLAKKVSYASGLMYEASSAQQALLTNDPGTAGTRLSLAQNYLTKLTPLITDGTDLQGLKTPVEDAVALYKTSPTQAVARLDTLIRTLHQLIESMQTK